MTDDGVLGTPTIDGLDESSDGIAVAVVQFSPGPNASDNLENIRTFVAAAGGSGARLVVLPEYSQAFAGTLGTGSHRSQKRLTVSLFPMSSQSLPSTVSPL